MPPKVHTEHRTRARSENRSSPLLGTEAIMTADPTLTRKGRQQSSAADHASTEAAGNAAPSTHSATQAAVSTAVVQQEGTDSSSAVAGSPASEQTRTADSLSQPQVTETQPSQQQGSLGLATDTQRSDGEVQDDLNQAKEGPNGGATAAMELSSNDSSPARIVPRGGGRGWVALTHGGILSQDVNDMLPQDASDNLRRAFNAVTGYVENLHHQIGMKSVDIIRLQDDAGLAESHRAAIESEVSGLSGTMASDMQQLQNHLEGMGARLREGEARAEEADARAAAADERAKAADARAEAATQRVAAVEAAMTRMYTRTEALEHTVARLAGRVSALEADDDDDDEVSIATPAPRQSPHTPATAYHSLRSTRPAEPASQVRLSEINLLALGAPRTRLADDQRSHVSAQTTRSFLRRPLTLDAPPRPSSVRDAPRSSMAATVRDAPPIGEAPRFPWSIADPTESAEAEGAAPTLADPTHARAAIAGGLKPDAQAQLDGAAREARDQQLWAVTRTLPSRVDLSEQLAAERAELHTKAEAERAALARERALLQEERAAMGAREQQAEAREQRAEARERALERQEAATARSMIARSLASLDEDGDSMRSSASRRPGDAGMGGAGGGAGGSGGHGSGSGRDSTVASSSRGDGDRKPAPAAQAAQVGAAVDELPGRPADLPRAGWFDARGNAITKVQVDIVVSHLPQVTFDGLSMAPLVTIQQILPDLIREKADAQRQRQRPMWPTLRSADDYGSNWFAPTLRAVVERLATSSGDNHRTGTLRGQLPGWLRQGKEMTAESDPVLLDWIFERIAKHLELRRPGELAADLVRWVVKPGLALRDFVYEFSQASAAVLSADPRHDNFVLTALLEVCRTQYPSTSSSWRPISVDPHSHTTNELLDILRAEAEHAVHDAIARKDNMVVYPPNLRSYTTGTMGAGGATTTAPGPKPQQTTAQKEAARKQALLEKQERQISYMVFAIQTFGSGPPASRSCFNCGDDGHSFARCDQPYNAANWDAAVEKLPWVLKFRPTGHEDFKRLCARALERAASGEAGRSAQQVYESQRDGGGRGGGRRGRGRGRGRN